MSFSVHQNSVNSAPKVQEMAFQRLQISKFFGGAYPTTRLEVSRISRSLIMLSALSFPCSLKPYSYRNWNRNFYRNFYFLQKFLFQFLQESFFLQECLQEVKFLQEFLQDFFVRGTVYKSEKIHLLMLFVLVSIKSKIIEVSYIYKQVNYIY